MTDIFFSYRSNDRQLVRPAHDAFAALGFDVFWDQEVPAGVDWDTWIRRHLTQAKCAIVFWSTTSVNSDNVRHEAMIAKQQNKLIPVLLTPLTAEQFPMGLYAQQAANLIDWNGDLENVEWRRLRREVEAKLTPPWISQRMDELEAELLAERARREGAERRDRILQAQIAKEVQAQEGLRRERDKAVDDAATLETAVQKLSSSLSQSREEVEALSLRATILERERQTLVQDRDAAANRAAEAERRLLEAVPDPPSYLGARLPLSLRPRARPPVPMGKLFFAYVLLGLIIIFLAFYFFITKELKVSMLSKTNSSEISKTNFVLPPNPESTALLTIATGKRIRTAPTAINAK